MKAVGYFRETAGGLSLAQQAQMFQGLCRRHGYQVVATFEDDGWPAAKEEPVGFRALVSYLRQADRGFVVVVLPSAAALGVDPLTIARRYFQLAALATRVLLLNSDDDPTEAVLQHWLGAHQQVPGRRVRAAMARKAVMGEVLGCVPYGYRADPRHHLEVDPEEAAVVRHIYRLYLQEGLGLRRVVQRLNEEGFCTRRGHRWSVVAVRDILRNRAYLGTYNRFGVRVPGSHPALISADEFHQAQELLAGRRNSPRQPRRPVPFLLAGLVYCASCGNKMIGVTRHQRWRRRGGQRREAQYRYYQCQSRANQSWCNYHTCRAERLEEMVRRGLSGEGDVGVVVLPRGEGKPAAPPHDGGAGGRRSLQALRRLDRRLEGYLEAASRRQISPQRLSALALPLALRRLELEEALAQEQERALVSGEALQPQREREAALRRLQQQWEQMTFSERQALLRQVIHRISIGSDGVLIMLSL